MFFLSFYQHPVATFLLASYKFSVHGQDAIHCGVWCCPSWGFWRKVTQNQANSAIFGGAHKAFLKWMQTRVKPCHVTSSQHIRLKEESSVFLQKI